MSGPVNPSCLSKRYSGYQQTITISIYSLLKRSLLLILCIVHYLAGAQTDSLEFIQYRFDNGGISSEGYLREGQPDGYWKSYYPDGTLKAEGNRADFLLDGAWKFYSPTGQIQTVIRYAAGKKSGIREQWTDSVIVAEERYADDRQEGISRYYYPDGSLEKIILFENGREEGSGYHYNRDGVVDVLLTYRSGVLTKEQNINRYDRLGLRTGVWMEFYRTMAVKVEGTYKDDLKHGFWKYYQPNGNLIRIEKWIMGVLQEDEDETAKLEVRREIDPNTGRISSIGTYQNDEKQGVHRFFDENGNITNGQLYRAGILLAEGIYDDQGRKQGIWKYYYEDGTLKAIGKYINDRRDGEWKYYFEDGSLEQVGSYIYDEPDGIWRWYFSDGEMRKEQTFLEGLADGSYIEYNDSNQVIIQGQYVDGLKTGDWVYSIHNIIETGRYVQGERQGLWTETWVDIDQIRREGNWRNGLEEGIHTWYFKNGQIQRRGPYSNGLKDGIWESFTASGLRIITVKYEDGVEVKYNRTSIDDNGRY